RPARARHAATRAGASAAPPPRVEQPGPPADAGAVEPGAAPPFGHRLPARGRALGRGEHGVTRPGSAPQPGDRPARGPIGSAAPGREHGLAAAAAAAARSEPAGRPGGPTPDRL